MDYQNTEDAVRREACEKVKQIVKAIKAIKIKYYANFSKISEQDQETYQSLEKKLEQISESHDLNNLKVALMQEVSEKYEAKPENDMRERKQIDPEEILRACYGAIDAQKEALSRGRISQALRCQEILKKYINQIEEANLLNEVINYKREKFAELVRTREEIENSNKDWNDTMKECFIKISAQKRDDATKKLYKYRVNEIDKTKETSKSVK